jgi:hypothetical protein
LSAAIAEKSLVNDDVETLGVGVAAALLLVAGVDEPLLELELELPQAETPMLAMTTSPAITALLFSKCTLISSPPSANNAAGTQTCDTRSAAVTMVVSRGTVSVCA